MSSKKISLGSARKRWGKRCGVLRQSATFLELKCNNSCARVQQSLFHGATILAPECNTCAEVQHQKSQVNIDRRSICAKVQHPLC